MQWMHTNISQNTAFTSFQQETTVEHFHVIIFSDRQRIKKCDVCSELFAHKPIAVLIFLLWLFSLIIIILQFL